MERWFLLALLILMALPETANAVVCGTSMTLNTNGANTASYGQNVVSALTYPCLTILDPAGANALAINPSGQITISNALFGATLNTTPSLANGNGVVPTVGGAAVAAGNPLPISLGTGAILEVSPTAAANAVGNPFYVSPGTGANFAGAAPMQSTGGTVGLVAGAAIVGRFGIDQTTPGTTNAVQTIPSTTGGISGYHLAGGSAASTNATNIKNAPGQIYYIFPQNPTTSIAYLRMYNLAAAPTCSSSTGVLHDYAIGAAPATGQPNGFVLPITVGETYGTGISFCLTGAIGDTDTTNAPVGVSVDIGYK